MRKVSGSCEFKGKKEKKLSVDGNKSLCVGAAKKEDLSYT